jgi:hypothetical protein
MFVYLAAHRREDHQPHQEQRERTAPEVLVNVKEDRVGKAEQAEEHRVKAGGT